MKKIIIAIAILLLTGISTAGNIDPADEDMQYAWSENTGWLNFEPTQGGGVQVSSTAVAGFIWAENIGWVNLSPTTYGGVFNDGSGNLSGYAWGENVGWINFAPVVPGSSIDYGVKIDSVGSFTGWAWGENIGWVNFDLADKYVLACNVSFEDLVNFASVWLFVGVNPGDLDGDADSVDVEDFGILSGYWLDFCPDSWPLK